MKAYHPNIDGIGWEDIWGGGAPLHPARSPIRAATGSEYGPLKESIATFGVLQPVVQDEAGRVVAGRLRKRACQELGVPCPTQVVAGLTEVQKEQLTYELEFCRKQLSLKDKRLAAKFALKSAPRTPDRVVGRACGLDHKTVGRLRDSLVGAGEIPHVESRLGADGKAYKFTRIVANTNREEERAKAALQELGPDAPKKPLDLRRAELLARCKRAEQRRAIRRRRQGCPTTPSRLSTATFGPCGWRMPRPPCSLPTPPTTGGPCPCTRTWLASPP